MRLLLDTHALLWAMDDESKLSSSAADLLSEFDNSLVLSAASYWEIAVKLALGKYRLSKPFERYFREAIQILHLKILPIELSHAAIVAELPRHHGDPFDRLLVAQAKVEQIPIVSRDPALDAYGIERLW